MKMDDWFDQKNRIGAAIVQEAMDEYFENQRRETLRLVKFCHETLSREEDNAK